MTSISNLHHLLFLVHYNPPAWESPYAIIIPLIAIGIPVFLILQYLYQTIKQTRKVKTKIKQYQNSSLLDQLLTDNNIYYKHLPLQYQEEFRARTLKMAGQLRWISGDSLVITEEMKLLVSASAVQLLFGLDKRDLGNYTTIVLFADQYYNDITQRYHKGEVNNRCIVLSYKHFTEGYSNPDDKINLGLHEMAHALDISTFLSYGKEYFLRRLFENFMNKTHKEFLSLQEGKNNFLRDYGAQNYREFFAVAVEHFFEAPSEFEQQLPNLYRELCIVLNQDPASKLCRGIHPQRVKHADNQISEQQTIINPINFKSKHSLTLLIPPFPSSIFLFPFFLSISLMLDMEGIPFILPMSILIGSHIFIAFRNRINHFIIRGEYLIIRSPLKFRQQSIHLSNIIVVAIERVIVNYNISISYFEDGKVLETGYTAYIQASSFEKLHDILISKEITVELEGKLDRKLFFPVKQQDEKEIKK
jgi:Mlc titration factor MtfA (ptsG expression regulator)